MPVNIETTSGKYHGRMAETYETKRKKQQRWDIENDVVAKMLAKLKPKSILDVPVGTGRYIPIYDKLRVKMVLGVDVSDSMLAIAKEKARKTKRATITLKCRDVRKLKTITVDVSVCVRFLDLIDEQAMRQVMAKLMNSSKRAIICTIRLGPEYVPKSNTATHDSKKFHSFVRKHGWRVAKHHAVFTQGWFILLLKPDQ
jgi:SAM-dependent methyltransferase